MTPVVFPANRRSPPSQAGNGPHAAGLRDAVRYRDRALEYRQLDDLIRDRCRFLAAASLVSHVMGLVEQYAFFVVGRAGTRLLSHIGASLHRLNLQFIHSLSAPCARLDARSRLDARWVHVEQSAVQGILDAFRSGHPERFAASMRGIDRLLAFAAFRPPLMSFPAALLCDVVGTLAAARGDHLRFESQEQREDIGLLLVSRIAAGVDCPPAPTQY